jgi:hypothetical protein
LRIYWAHPPTEADVLAAGKGGARGSWLFDAAPANRRSVRCHHLSTSRIEAAAHTVADLDRRLGQIDTAIEEVAKRGKTNTALSAMEAQRRARAGLTSERNEAAGTLWQPSRQSSASLAAQGRRIETEATPIRYVAELIAKGDPPALPGRQ